MGDIKSLCQFKLKKQSEQLEAMTLLLGEELDVLSARNGTRLKELSREKLQLITAIKQLDDELSKFDQTVLKDPELEPALSEVTRLLDACKNQNEINAKAAHHAQLGVKELKDILLGASQSLTYDQSGGVNESKGKLVRNLKA